MVKNGLSAFIGFWKIIAAPPPRKAASCDAEAPLTCCPVTLTLPSSRAASGINPRQDMAVIDLPEPDSPTNPRISPRLTLRSMPRTAFTVLNKPGKDTVSPSTSSTRS
ncbi:hypothetical protein D9M69_436330 [compost metagenome]